jgi:hypothetical protein
LMIMIMKIYLVNSGLEKKQYAVLVRLLDKGSAH